MSTDPRSLRVENYWTARARDFGTVRKNELNDAISGRWLEEFRAELPVTVDSRNVILRSEIQDLFGAPVFVK